MTSIDRQVLYDELWTTPGTKLAKKYGISDVALGKACKRHNIPRPPVGFWTLVKHGYEVERTPLPPIEDARLRKVCFQSVALESFDVAEGATRDGAGSSSVQIAVGDDGGVL